MKTLKGTAHLDPIDWQLLRELQDNARLPFTELGRRVGLSSPAVAERVRGLEDAGVITGYHAAVDPAKVGWPLAAYIRVVSTGAACRQVESLARELPEVMECHHVTGEDAFVLRVAAASLPHLEHVIYRLAELAQPTTAIVLSSPVSRRTIGIPIGEGR